MMENIRTAANSVVVKIIFGVIILAFIFTGVGGFLGFGGSSSDDERLYIAKVDGEGISRAAFEREAQLATQNTGTLGGDDSFQKMIRRSVLSNQIDNYLAYKFSESLNTKISDQQVKNVIRQQSVFFENRSFSNKRYLELLAANNYTPEIYADGLRSAIKQEQVMNALMLSDFVLPVDSDISVLQNQQRTVYIADYSLQNIDNEGFTVTDDEIQQYYDNNQQEFYHPERLKMKFVTNFLPAVKKSTKIPTTTEIETYYKEGKKGLISPEKHLYSIFSFDDLDSAKKQYQSIGKMKNEERLSVQMDKIGWFSVDETLPQLLHDADLNQAGAISNPIEQGNIYYIVRLDQIEKAQKLPFEYAKNSIRQLLYQEEVDKQYQKQQIKLEKAAKLPTMEEISEESGLELYESDWTFEKESYSIGRFPEISAAAFSDQMIKDGKPTGEISDIIHIEQYDSSYIIQVTNYEEAGISSPQEVKDKIENKLLLAKKKEVFNESVDMLLTQLKETGSADAIQFAQKITVNRKNTNNELNEKAIDEIFSIVPDINNNGYGIIILNQENAKFFALVDVKNEEISDISNELKAESLKINQQYLLSNLRAIAKIEIMPNANL